VTVRDRDSMDQIRLSISELPPYLGEHALQFSAYDGDSDC
jgi:glycyl-tRNA synthetase (class II)